MCSEGIHPYAGWWRVLPGSYRGSEGHVSLGALPRTPWFVATHAQLSCGSNHPIKHVPDLLKVYIHAFSYRYATVDIRRPNGGEFYAWNGGYPHASRAFFLNPSSALISIPRVIQWGFFFITISGVSNENRILFHEDIYKWRDGHATYGEETLKFH